MSQKIYFPSFEALYESISEESIDYFWEVYTSHFPREHPLAVDTSNMTTDDKIEIAWRMTSTFPVIEKRFVKTKQDTI
ncbi:hypothetical protein [Vibrio owensii]|uniref:hypothetical protein n=1 Tax=Vibrio owensii TaxID=696485 RepID=UPI0018F27125|nr:hypothetical protein [Vibrio owensii]